MVISKASSIKKDSQPDYLLLGIICFLLFWGIVTLTNVSFPFSLQRYGNPWIYFFHQLLMLAIGSLLGIIFFKISLKTLKKWASLLFFLNLILLVLVFLPSIGKELGGARRWLAFGNFWFQPSEFLKVSFLLYLAAWLTKRKSSREKKFSLLFFPFFIILLSLVTLLILEPDLSTLGIILLGSVLMYFVAQTPWWHTLLMGVMGIGGGVLLVKIAPYRLARVLVYLKPETDLLGIGYQLRQALIALGSGRIFGIEGGFALGLSRQKFGFLPHPMTDSIFAIIGEELGFLGAAFLICLFLALAWRGLRISQISQDSFPKILALGITVWFVFQAFFNIGGIVGILPLAGIPLPFFSYGGSHLIAELIGVGILLNISRQVIGDRCKIPIPET
ncbi:MAG: putative lipid II flippase FtsW [Patescibacteria group bacterium]|nr:putative lipid II flippase FtsW [Patescibacteria group bacterium]